MIFSREGTKNYLYVDTIIRYIWSGRKYSEFIYRHEKFGLALLVVYSFCQVKYAAIAFYISIQGWLGQEHSHELVPYPENGISIYIR
jgi:hypothetical protein